MKTVVGNKNIELDGKELNDLAKCYDQTIVDLGTGDGRFVFKEAIKNPDNFYIGVDPSEKQLQLYSKKALRKKLPNVIFCLGSIELLPEELKGIANRVLVHLPWGTLLKNAVLPSRESCKKLATLLKTSGKLELTFGYHEEFEPSETERLDLPPLTKEYIENTMIPKYEKCGFSLLSLEKLNMRKLKKLETTWSKKLSFGKIRDIFRLTLTNK